VAPRKSLARSGPSMGGRGAAAPRLVTDVGVASVIPGPASGSFAPLQLWRTVPLRWSDVTLYRLRHPLRRRWLPRPVKRARRGWWRVRHLRP
jgi:hypothetical protein